MNRQEKEQVVQALRQDFQESSASFLVNYRGLSVAQFQQLRKGVRAQNGNVRVAKARLMKLASDDIVGAQELSPFFHDQVAVVFVKGEAPAIAKVLKDFAKENEALDLVAGYLDSTLLDAQAINAIASLPSREQLLAQLCGTLQAPIAQFARVLHTLVAQPVRVLKRIEEQKSEQGA